MWEILLIVYFILYCLFLGILIVNWRKIKFNQPLAGYSPFVSVIIPCRNEKENITNTLSDLNNQDYEPENFEVIVVDDHSEDSTVSEILNFTENINVKIKVVKLEETEGKKAAITAGVKEAGGEIIAVTDGDCRRNASWLRSMVNSHKFMKNDLSFGLVKFSKSDSFFSRILSLEQASLIGTGAVMSGMGVPIMANGANMLFNKKEFEAVRGFSGNLHIPSGDDEFLLTKFKKHDFKIGFVATDDSIVETMPPQTISAFLNQRKRWAGKWKASHNPFLKLTATGAFLMQIFWLVCITGVILEKALLAYFLLGLLLKVIFDYIFLRKISRRLNRKVHFFPFVFLELVYPFYAIYFAIVSNFGWYTWKGRKKRT